MASPGQSPTPRRQRRWTALGGLVLFVLLGVVVLPGLVRQESGAPAPAREPGPPAAEPVAPAGSPGSGAAFGGKETAADTPSGSAGGLEIDAFDCMILASEVVEIGSPVTGRIEEIRVERGDPVEAGEVLVRLESSVERAAVRLARERARRDGELESARANLELTRKRRERALELFERDSLSLDEREQIETEAVLAASELQRARENRRIASLELEQALAALERRTLRSPVSGVVVERLMAPGEVVDEETILRVAQVDPLRVEVIVPSQLFGRVEPGDPAEVLPEAPLDAPRAAQVAIVDPVIDGASGTFGARLLLPNPDRELPAGLRCQVRLLDEPDPGEPAPPKAG